MCVVHRYVANCVTLVVTEARHDPHFCHCAVVCTNPSCRDIIPTGSAYEFLGGNQLSNKARSIISRQEEDKLLNLKKKNIPITGPRCSDGSRKLRFPDYVTMAQDGGKVVSLTHRPLLPPGNTPGTHFC